MEYMTRYPKTVSLEDGEDNKIHVDKKTGVEELHLIVKESAEKMKKILFEEGFTTVKFEHKQPLQIGDGLSLKLKKPWEMHVRMVDLEDGKIGIHAEVEVSRDYLQHLFSQRTPVVYEVEEILKKYQIDYNIWHDKIKKNITTVVDNYKVKLATPGILAVMAPIAVGFGLGVGALGAYLAGAIGTGTLMAVFLSNSGGAWDNAKKMVEDGHYGGKGTDAHAATVVGDTVGDPFKDTAGPAINPLIKVMNLVGLLITPAIVSFALPAQSSVSLLIAAVATLIIIGALIRNRRQSTSIEY